MSQIVHPEDEEPIQASRFTGYFGFLRSEWDTFVWLFREFTTPKGRRHIRNMVCLLAIVTSLSVVLPAIVATAVNAVAAHDLMAIKIAIAAFALCGLTMNLISFLEGREREWTFGLNIIRLDERITELLFSKPLGQHERHGSMLNYASIDKGKWKTVALMDMLIYQGVPGILISIFALVGLWWINPLFGAIATVFTAIFYTCSLWMNYQVGYNMHSVEREFRRINRVRVERWEKSPRVITSGTAEKEICRLSEEMNKNMDVDRKFWIKFIAWFNIRGFLVQRLLVIFALSYGAYLVYQGEWQIGYLFPLVVWTETLNAQMIVLSHVERQIGRDIIPIQLMRDALSIEPSFNVAAGVPLPRNGPLEVCFNDVTHSYKDASGKVHPVLRNISLGIAPGEKIALIGPSGAGKTTLMKLLLRYEDPTSGSVLLNGKPLSDYLLASYMEQVGYIPQHAMIFDSTIGENLLYGVSPEERERLLANNAAGLWEMMRSLKIDFGARLNNGINTLVGHHGLKLSGGQAQRVMIGAAVAKKPRLMVIDEATSSLDSTTEREVQDGIAAALEYGTTALIVAHRLSTVRTLCDRFVVLRPLSELSDGESQIEAIAGSFEELVLISPTFARLAKDQGVHI